MNFLSGDILIRKNRHTGVETIWVNQRLISEQCNVTIHWCESIRNRYKSSVTPCHRHHNILPDTGKSWRWSKIGQDFYYDLSRIPNRNPKRYRDLFGDATALKNAYKQAMQSSFNMNFDATMMHFVNQQYQYFLQHYIAHMPVQRVALAKACAVLSFTARYVQENPDLKANSVIKDVCSAVARQDLRYVPRHFKRLKQKIDPIINQDLEAQQIIRLPRANNANSLTYDDPVIKACAVKMRAMPQNYTNEYIIRTIQKAYKIRGKRVPGRRWFGQNVFEKQNVKFLTESGRYGLSRKSFENRGYIPMENALFAGDCWQIDATRVNMIEHRKDDNSKGFLFVVAVMDVHSGDIVGHSFDYSENRWSVINALKMAVKNTGYLPYELVCDRFPGHNTDEVKALFTQLKMLGVEITTTHKATGKAHLERGFSTLQTVFMQDSDYFYGEGVQSSRNYAHRSAEYLKNIRKQAKKENFDLTQAYNQADAVISAYKRTNLSHYSRNHRSLDKSPMDLHDQSDKPNVKRLKDYQISMLFGLKKKVTIKHNGQIKTEIQKAEYIYHIDDYAVYSNHYKERIVLSYNLDNLDKVYLFKVSGSFLVYLCDASLFHKPQRYGPQAEFDKIDDAKWRLAAIEQRKAKELQQVGASNELDLLMGVFTDKKSAENAETLRILKQSEDEHKPLKKGVVSGETTAESSAIDWDSYITNQL